MTVQAGLCQTWSKTPKASFLTSRLNCSFVIYRLLSGGVNWGRILTLFSFGYRIAVRVLQLGERIADFAQTLKNVVSNVVTFIRDTSEGIARWIASQGGWVSFLEYFFTLLVQFDKKLSTHVYANRTDILLLKAIQYLN